MNIQFLVKYLFIMQAFFRKIPTFDAQKSANQIFIS